MSILRGRIYCGQLESVPAEFVDRTLTCKEYPDGFDFTVSSLVFARDEPTGDTVFSPNEFTTVEVLDGDSYHTYNSAECGEVFGVSIFSFVDLFVSKRQDQVNDLVYNALCSREYTVED